MLMPVLISLFLIFVVTACVYANVLISERATEDEGLRFFKGLWLLLGSVSFGGGICFLIGGGCESVLLIPFSIFGWVAIVGVRQLHDSLDGRGGILSGLCWLCLSVLPFVLYEHVTQGWQSLVSFCSQIVGSQGAVLPSNWLMSFFGVIFWAGIALYTLFFVLSLRMMRRAGKIAARRELEGEPGIGCRTVEEGSSEDEPG